MKCGDFDKRNKDYNKLFSTEVYFRKLILGTSEKEWNNNLNGDGKVIFDVGAHKGESAIFFHKLFPEAKIYSFEPNPFAARNIIELKLKNVTTHQIALSDFNGHSEFNIQDISHLSSLHKINHQSHQSLGYAEKESHTLERVKVLRGDTFMNENEVDRVDLLKIDVQANEVKTIQGFSSILCKVKTVFVEVSLYDFYENRSSIGKIEESLPNFELFDIYEISKNPKTLGTDWVTLVYKNSCL
jgi:FkbM family methyltransferase